MKIQTIIFDWGNVIELIDQKRFLQEMARRHDLDKGEFMEVESESRALFDAGKLDSSGYLSRMGNRLGVRFDQSYFNTFFDEYVVLNEPMVEVVTTLSGISSLRICSNTNEAFHEHMRDSGLLPLFDRVVLSYDVGLKKPDAHIYMKTIEGSDISTEQCIFLDDDEENVKAAARIGMRSFLYVSVARFKQDLAENGLHI